jgi:hypothetical protein
MDKGIDTTQRIVIVGSIILGLTIVLVIGYSLWNKAQIAQGELANKEALDAATKGKTTQASISLTGEAKNSSNFTYDGLVQKAPTQPATTTNFDIVNETVPVAIPKEDPVPPEATDTAPVEPEPLPVKKVRVYVAPVDEDQPLTAAEIRAIRQLPVDNSPSGNLQTSLEDQSSGQYKARY